MGKFLENLAALVMLPLFVMKWVGWIVCAIWLLSIDDWRIVVGSLMAGWIGGYVLPLINAIIMLLYLPFISKAHCNLFVASIMTVFARVLTCVLLISWCIICLNFVDSVEGMSNSTFIPRLLMSYCMAIHTIWNLTAGNFSERNVGGIANFFSVILCALGYLLVVILLICDVELSFLLIIGILAGFLIISIPISVIEVVLTVRRN